MSRRERQHEELRRLCRHGRVAHAIDLAFEHFASFGRDDEVVHLLAMAIELTPVAADVRRRFEELAATA